MSLTLFSGVRAKFNYYNALGHRSRKKEDFRYLDLKPTLHHLKLGGVCPCVCYIKLLTIILLCAIFLGSWSPEGAEHLETLTITLSNLLLRPNLMNSLLSVLCTPITLSALLKPGSPGPRSSSNSNRHTSISILDQH